MNLFYDTSSLFKLYHKEEGTVELINFFTENSVNAIYLSEITDIEFSSAVWKKCRKKEIVEDVARMIIEKFELDSKNYRFIPYNSEIIKLAKNLIAKYWKNGLRTLDAVQLASALAVKNDIDRFFTADNLLAGIAQNEGFKTNV